MEVNEESWRNKIRAIVCGIHRLQRKYFLEFGDFFSLPKNDPVFLKKEKSPTTFSLCVCVCTHGYVSD